jgi:hypothetical protein
MCAVHIILIDIVLGSMPWINTDLLLIGFGTLLRKRDPKRQLFGSDGREP